MNAHPAEQLNIAHGLRPLAAALLHLEPVQHHAEHAYRTVRDELEATDPETRTADIALRALDHLLSVRVNTTAATDKLVTEARARGATWPQIATRLGVTPQAVQQRYGSEPT